MIKTYLKRLIFTFLLLIGGLWAFASPQEERDYTSTPLLPEVEALLKIPEVTEEMLEGNAYPALMGIYVPIDIDFIEVGKKIVFDSTVTSKKALETRNLLTLLDVSKLRPDGFYMKDRSDNVFFKYFSQGDPLKTFSSSETKGFSSCNSLRSLQRICLESVVTSYLEDRAKFEVILDKNKLLLERYRTIRNQPSYTTYINSLHEPFVPFSIAAYLSNLELVKAVFLINDGMINEGFSIVEKEQQFWEKVITNKNVLMLDADMGIFRLQHIYDLVSELLALKIFDPMVETQKVANFIKPLSKEFEQVVVNAFRNEFTMLYRNIYYFDKAQYEQFNKNKKRILFSLADSLGSFDINATLNLQYEIDQYFINTYAQPILPESGVLYRKYLSEGEQLEKNNQDIVDNIMRRYKDKKHLIDKESVYPLENYRKQLEPQYDLLITRALVNAQYKIKKANIYPDKITQFLSELGDEAINPYTLEPFVWDQKSQTLSTKILSQRGARDINNPRNNKTQSPINNLSENRQIKVKIGF